MSESPKGPPSKGQDLVAGSSAVLFGLLVLVTSLSYPTGSLLRMGPGFFPAVLAGLIMLLGLALLASAWRAWPPGAPVVIRFRPVAAIGAGIILFALLLGRAGLVPATLALVLVSSLAEPVWRPKRAIGVALAMMALMYVVFIVVLRTPIAAVRF